ncbi:MAG: PcfJ domain-containing protein [Ruminococcus sp.]|nr:PcfJ domain-containing protein [Ruminococcus sp.]
MLKAARESTCWYNLADKSIRFFCECCEHPNIEYLIKTGFGYVADAKLGGYMHDIRVNWRSNDVKKMLKLNKVEMDELANTNMDTLSTYYRLRKLDPSMEPEERVGYAHKMYDIDTLELIIRETGLSLRKALNYRDKQKMGLRDWKDYIDQCKKLEYDISDESISRPKDFFAAHERLSRILETMANEEKQRLFDLSNKLRGDMQFVDEELGLMIVLPQSVSDIVREGKMQNHCVGGYADRHAEGKLHILFLRKISEPTVPYYTMEVNTNGTIVQCRGYANNWESRGGKPKTDDVIEFEKRYQKYLTKLFKKMNKPKQRIKVA